MNFNNKTYQVHFQQTLFDDFSELLNRIIQVPENSVLTVRLNDGKSEKLFSFDGEIISIGRSGASEIKLADNYVSRDHAKIFKRNHEYFLKDLGSANGTYLNKHQIQANTKVGLKTGDVIKIENFEMELTIIHYMSGPMQRVKLLPTSYTEGALPNFFELSPATGLIAEFKIEQFNESVYIIFEPEISTALISAATRQSIQETEPEPIDFYANQKSFFDKFFAQLERLYNKKYEEPQTHSIQFLHSDSRKNFLIPSEQQSFSAIQLVCILGENAGKVYIGIPGRLFKKIESYLIKSRITQVAPGADSDDVTPIDDTNLTMAFPISREEAGQKIEERPTKSTLSKIDRIPTVVKLSIGYLKISSYELGRIEAGDILPLTDLNLRFEKNFLRGEIFLYLADGSEYIWTANLITHENYYIIKIKKITQNNPADLQKVTPDVELHHENTQEFFHSIIRSNDISTPLNIHQVNDDIVESQKEAMLRRIQVHIDMQLTPIKIKLSDVLELKSGRNLRINYPLSLNVKLMIENQKLADGKIIAYQSGCALLVNTIVSE